MFLFHVGNGKWESQKQENFLVQNVKFQNGRIDSKSQPMQAKSAANYSNAALARMEALNAGYDEAIMLNNKGHVAEGSAENIFVVKNGRITTPPLDADILDGITRDSAIKLLKSNKIKVIEKNLKINVLLTADEIFMTGTARGINSCNKTKMEMER